MQRLAGARSPRRPVPKSGDAGPVRAVHAEGGVVKGTGETAAPGARSLLLVGGAHELAPRLTEATQYMPGMWSVLATEDATAAGRLLGSQRIHAAIVALRREDGGLAFLDWLRRHHPHVTRIAAFDTASSGTMDASNVAHQAVDTGVPAKELGHLIGRTVALQERLGTEKLVAWAGSLRRIPSVPRVYAELRSIVSDPDFELADLAAAIGRDPGLAVKILQVVNSAFYGLRQQVTDLTHAVSVLGAGTVTSLVLGITLHDQFSVLGAARKAVESEWQEALTLASSAKRIAAQESRDSALIETAYLAGLVHNVGRLIIAANLSDRFTAIDWPESRTEALAIERSVFGAGHPELGALLLGTWGLDDALVEAVAFYAEPAKSLGVRFAPLTALHVAAGLTSNDPHFLDERYLERLGLTPDPTHTHGS